MSAGGDPPGDPVLDSSGHSQAREAGNGASLRSARMRHHGEDSEVWGGRQDVGETCRRGRESTREDRPP